MNRLALLLAVLVSGCALQPQTTARIDRHGSPVVRQTGEAKTPSAASVTTTHTTLTIPAGSTVAIPSPTPPGQQTPLASPTVVTLSQPSELRTETRREAVAGAETFTPPAPPSLADKARATGIKWFYLAGLGAAVLAGLCVWRGYPIAAVKIGAAALAFPLVGNLVSEKWAMVAGGVLIALGFAFIAAWKIIAARHELPVRA